MFGAAELFAVHCDGLKNITEHSEQGSKLVSYLKLFFRSTDTWWQRSKLQIRHRH